MVEELLSVGIDIGTTTTQVIFSKLFIEDTGGFFSAPNITITDKQIVYQSEIYFTPLISLEILDADGIEKIVAQEYIKAGISKADIKTGAVIITGESARKENAKAVLDKLSSFAGEFVVSTAGPDLESVIAGKGSGAFEYSRKNHCRVVNLDIGGGTTNIVLFEDGRVLGKSCLDIGGHLVIIEDDKVVYISSGIQKLLKKQDILLKVGECADKEKLYKLCSYMAKILLECIGKCDDLELIYEDYLTDGSSKLGTDAKNAKIVFSGGVADLITNKEGDFRYGDIGDLLGYAIYQEIDGIRDEIITTNETIRATVIGAGMYTTEISGSTITCTYKNLPAKNIPIFYLEQNEIDSLSNQMQKITEKLKWFIRQNDTEQFAIGFYGIKSPNFEYLIRLAKDLKALYDNVGYEKQIMIIVYEDCAKALGEILDSQFSYKREILCIDKIIVNSGDYIDFGEPIMEGRVIPVVVKTLLFSS